MNPREIYYGSDGAATKALYARLEGQGPIGIVAMNIFRAQKASERAKGYSRRYKGDAYQKKNWSLGLLCDALDRRAAGHGIRFGWKRDPNPPIGFPWILYIDLPTGQASFHAADRGAGPDYPGEWDQSQTSAEVIIKWVTIILGEVALREEHDPEFEDRSDPPADDYESQLLTWKRKHGLA